jgi:hypothetical protein
MGHKYVPLISEILSSWFGMLPVLGALIVNATEQSTAVVQAMKGKPARR